MQDKESKTTTHFRISLVKSMIRIVGGLYLILTIQDFSLFIFGMLFTFAEVLGIFEEIL